MGDLSMDLINLTSKFSTDDKCRELLRRLRWPNGPECPRCHSKAKELDTDKQLFWCGECQYQFSVTAGTIFNDSHLPLIKWFAATFLLCEARKGMSANQIKRTLGISYKTAWYLCHRIRASMKEIDRPMLDGTVEMDETYVGGKATGGKRGRGSENKEVVIGIRKRGGELRFFHSSDVKSGTLAQYIKDNISVDVDVMMTDDLQSYPAAIKKASLDTDRHKTVRHSEGEYVVGTVHTNTVENAFSLLKRGITGTWHKISAKHLASYLDEMEFRFNRRKSHVLFLDTLRHMVTCPVLTFERLIA
jgi:transposase-like protein